MDKYFTIPVTHKDGEATLVFNKEIVEKLNLGEVKNIHARFTESGLELQKMVSIDVDIDEDILKTLTEMAKKENKTIDEIFVEALDKIGFNK